MTTTTLGQQKDTIFAIGQDGEAAQAMDCQGRPLNYQSVNDGGEGTAKRNSRWENLQNTRYKKRNKWGDISEKVCTPQTFSYIPRHLLRDQVEIMIYRHRLDDLQRRLAINDYESNDQDIRSPSPEPIYDSKTGQRTNTKELRNREQCIEERMRIIEQLLKLDRTFKAPNDYKPPKKYKKIYFPVSDDPNINFIGRILGPRGTTQKQLQAKSNSKIAIRGKGANTKGVRAIGPYKDDQNQPLHVLIQAETERDIQIASNEINKLIQMDQNSQHKRMQLMTLASYNGMLQEIWCESCGEQGHRSWNCPNITKSHVMNKQLRCQICGDRSHPTKDCPERKQGTEIALRHQVNKFMKDFKARQSKNEEKERERNAVLDGNNNQILVSDGKHGQKYINVEYGTANAIIEGANSVAMGGQSFAQPALPYAYQMMVGGGGANQQQPPTQTQPQQPQQQPPQIPPGGLSQQQIQNLFQYDQYAALHYQAMQNAYQQQQKAGYQFNSSIGGGGGAPPQQNYQYDQGSGNTDPNKRQQS